MSDYSGKTYFTLSLSVLYIAGDDFVALEEDVMVARGEEPQCFDIPTIDDDVVEPSESFMVLLSNANGVDIVDGSVSIPIADNGDRKYKFCYKLQT